jgi:hypothetical protein
MSFQLLQQNSSIKKSKLTYYNLTAPPLVTAWRQGKIDWHDLLPKHLSSWERFGTPTKDNQLRLLIGKEEQLTDMLTQFAESGLSQQYGYNHGVLDSYSAWYVYLLCVHIYILIN